MEVIREPRKEFYPDKLKGCMCTAAQSNVKEHTAQHRASKRNQKTQKLGLWPERGGRKTERFWVEEQCEQRGQDKLLACL